MIIKEKHQETCACSYCVGKNKLHYGLNIPPDWAGWNSWYVFKFWERRYIRWTNRWLYKNPPNKVIVEE